jgi:YHS domain-containing protein
MNVGEERARAEKHVFEHKGTTYYFCSIECRDEFARNPGKYTGASQAPTVMPGTTSQKQVKNHKDHADMPMPGPSKESGKRDPHGDMSMPSRYGGRGEVQPDAGREGMRMPPAAAQTEMPMSPVAPVPGINPMTGNTPQPKGSGIFMQPGSPAMPGPSPGTAVAPMPGRPVMGPPSMKAPVPGGVAIPGAPAAPAMKTQKPGGTAAAMPGTSPKGPSPPGADEREDDHD